MKIAIEAQRIFRKKKHGMDIAVLELIRALQRIDIYNEYFIIAKAGEDNKVLSETPNFHIIETRFASYPVWEQKILPAKLKEIDPDVLHCTSDTAPLQVNCPLVLTLHDILFMNKVDLRRGTLYQRAGNVYRRWVVPKVVKKCCRIITVSNFEQKEIIKCFPNIRDKVVTIYNAQSEYFKVVADINELKKYKEDHDLPDNFILYLGNTHPNKNLVNVLRLLKILNQYEQTRIPLVIPDVNQQFLNAMLGEAGAGAEDIRDYIHLTGYVPNKDLVYLYNLATLFIYPSFYESFGIPILESMACGTPVITSNRAAMPETAGGAANLADPFNPQNMSVAVLELICNEEVYNRCVVEGLKRAGEFSWKSAAEAVLETYKEIYNEVQLVGH